MNFVRNNWQAVVFAVVGFVGLYYTFQFLQAEKVTEASAVFGIAFLSFLYANLSRFKRFKGLGFEAELWEDKQKEAADLIERLKNVVAIYTSEIVMSKVASGRLSDGPDWKENWKLYNDLVAQHDVLGQKIDFSNLKKGVDRYFLYDMYLHARGDVEHKVEYGRTKARAVINKEIGGVIADQKRHAERLDQLKQAEIHIKDGFAIAEKGNPAAVTLERAKAAKEKLKVYFDVDIEFDLASLSRLEAIAHLFDNQPVTVTDELISWAQIKS